MIILELKRCSCRRSNVISDNIDTDIILTINRVYVEWYVLLHVLKMIDFLTVILAHFKERHTSRAFQTSWLPAKNHQMLRLAGRFEK